MTIPTQFELYIRCRMKTYTFVKKQSLVKSRLLKVALKSTLVSDFKRVTF